MNTTATLIKQLETEQNLSLREMGILHALKNLLVEPKTVNIPNTPQSLPIPQNRSNTFSIVGYDPTHCLLRLTFRSHGRTYLYGGVSIKEFEKFMSGSLGRYYNNNIKGQKPVIEN